MAVKVNMKARSDLSNATREVVESWKVTQAVAAKRLGVTQPRLNDLLRGRINRFSVDALMELANRAGLAVRVELGAVPLTVSPPKLEAPILGGGQDHKTAAHARPPDAPENSVSESEAIDRKKIKEN